MLSTWRKKFLEHAHQVFESTPDQETKKLKREIANLERMVGKKEVELGLIKNFVDFYESPSGR
jgi:hypothetical protein